MLTPGQVALARSLDRGAMWDTWKCERPGSREFDGTTGVWTDEPPETVYDGPGSLSDRSIIGRRVETQGETTVVGTLRLSLPIATSAAIRVDDVLTCTVGYMDDALVGASVRVTDIDAQSYASARRFSVEVESWPTTT